MKFSEWRSDTFMLTQQIGKKGEPLNEAKNRVLSKDSTAWPHHASTSCAGWIVKKVWSNYVIINYRETAASATKNWAVALAMSLVGSHNITSK